MDDQIYSRGWTGRFTALFFLSLSALATKEMRLGQVAAAVSEPIEAVVNSLNFPDSKGRLRESYTGIALLDFGLRFLVAAFLPGVAGWDKNFQIQQSYFLISFFPVIAVWSVEAGRKRNYWALTSFTSVWALLYQTVGGGVIVPLYYLAYMRESTRTDYWSPASRHLTPSYAKALLPSLVIGYLVPTILMYLPFPDPSLRLAQGLVAFWQFSPLVVNFLLYAISTVYGKEPTALKEATSPPLQDTKYLNRLYLICFIVSAITHFGAISWCLLSTDPQVSLTHALILVPASDRVSLSGCLHYIFQVDYWTIFAAAMAGAYLNLWDLKRIGMKDLSLGTAAAGMAVAAIFVGPAATVAGVWYIREQILAQKHKK